MATNKYISDSAMAIYWKLLEDRWPHLVAGLDRPAFEDRLHEVADNLSWSGSSMGREDVIGAFMDELEVRASAEAVLAQRRLEAEYRSTAARRH
jgi:hypothetical protein